MCSLKILQYFLLSGTTLLGSLLITTTEGSAIASTLSQNASTLSQNASTSSQSASTLSQNASTLSQNASTLSQSTTADPIPLHKAIATSPAQASSTQTANFPPGTPTLAQLQPPVADPSASDLSTYGLQPDSSVDNSQSPVDSSQSDTAQVTSVSQLSDVNPADWAYEALERLIERYGCIAGYPDGTYRGSRALTRYEFAAGLNACLDALAEQLTGDVSEEDLSTLQRLIDEFRTELASLRGRVDGLEPRVTALEENQFSTTGRLNVLSSFNFSQAFAGGDILAEGIPVPGSSPASRLPLRFLNPLTGTADPVVGVVEDDPSLTFSHSTYFIFSFSATGRDTLTAILAAGNGDPPASTFSSAGFTSTFGIPYADSNPVTPLSANSLGLFELKYSFPVTDNLQVVVGPRILPFRHFDLNPYTNILTGASGLNFYQSTLAGNGLSGAGGLVEWTINPHFTLRAGYLARNDASQQIFGGDGPSNPDRGLFNSTNTILAELTYSPSPNANIRLLYSRSRLDAPPAAPSGFNFPFLLSSLRGAVDDGFGGTLNDVIANNFVLNFDWTISRGFGIFGRYSYSTSDIDPTNSLLAGGNVNVQAFELGAAFPDLGKPGALATVAVAIPFDVVGGSRFLVAGNGDGGTEVDVAAAYAYPISDNISLVPMFFATFNANNFSENPPVYSIILRTQFLF